MANSNILKIAGNLMAACFISGIVIGAVYYVTAPIAKEKAEEMKQASMRELVADADTFEPLAGKEGWMLAEKGGAPAAYIIPSESKGYGGAIKMLVAVDTKGAVIDYSILVHNETPGLGDKAQEKPFRSQIQGKHAEHLKVTKEKSNTEDVQAMTGATISSRAVTKAVKQAVDEAIAYQKEQGGK